MPTTPASTAPAGRDDHEREAHPSASSWDAYTAVNAPPVPRLAPKAPPGAAGRGTPLEALAGWSGSVVVGAACWVAAAAVVSRAL